MASAFPSSRSLSTRASIVVLAAVLVLVVASCYRLKQVTSVRAGATNGCAVLSTGQVRCWGANDVGQLGDGSTASRTYVTTLVSGITSATEVAVGGSHACALLADDTVRCWGSNTSGQLGDGTNDQALVPVTVSGLTDAVQISAGGDHTCAVRAAGGVSCWGENGSGQLGAGAGPDHSTPVSITLSALGAEVSAGTAHTCARLTDGTVACWGLGTSGQLGNGAASSSPTPVGTGVDGATAISAGGAHSCAIVAEEQVRCWGSNSDGQIGDGTTSQRNSPTLLDTVAGASQITAGGQHSCAVVEGTVRCWGRNDEGQIGDGTLADRLVPVLVVSPDLLLSVDAGLNHTCAVKDPDLVVCWGANTSGQLGDGQQETIASLPVEAVYETTTTSKPVPMGGPRNFFGTGDLLAAPARENLWMSVGGYCARHETGDRITPRADAEDATSASDFESCTPGAPAGVRANPEYTPDGYFYALEIPANVSGTRNVDLYDAAACGTSGGLVDTGHEAGAERGYTFRLRSNDAQDPAQATILATTTVTPANCSTYDDQWRTMFTLTNPTAGIYYLQISPVIPTSRTVAEGQNQMSLRVVDPAWGGSWACTFDAAFAVSNAPHRTDCPKVYGVTHLGVYASFTNAFPEFFLASIGPEHATQQAQIELFDPAEGAQQIEILDPNGDPIDFTWEIACQDATYRSENGGTCSTGENPPTAPGYGPVTGVNVMDVSGTVTIANRPWGGRNAQDGRYSDRLIRLSFDLPSAADEPTWFSGRTWYKIRYTAGASPADRTTWSIMIVDDPVPLGQ